MRKHTQRWECSAKSHGTTSFHTRKDFDDHFAQDHKRRYGSAQLDLLAKRCSRSSAAIFEGCPLRCREIVPADGSHSLTDHVVGHLRSLALKSLPPHDEDGENLSSNEDVRISSAFGKYTERTLEFLKDQENSPTHSISSTQQGDFITSRWNALNLQDHLDRSRDAADRQGNMQIDLRRESMPTMRVPEIHVSQDTTSRYLYDPTDSPDEQWAYSSTG